MSARPAALAPLRHAAFRWYVAARAINLLGGTMGSIALAFAVLHVSDSPGALGAVLAAHSIPMIAFLLLGGVLADRFGRALVIQVGNVASGLSQLTIAALVLSGSAEVWHLVALTAVNGTVAAANQPALASLLPQLVPRAELQQANVLNSMLRNTIMALGPAAAGVLVATAGPGWALAVDGAAYLASAALLLRIRMPAAARLGHAARASMVEDLRRGWAFFRATPWLLTAVPTFGALNALQSGGQNTLGPVYAQQGAIGAAGWGLIASATAVGLLVTSLAFTRVRLERPLFWGTFGVAAFGLPMLALGLTDELWVVLLAAVAAGAGVEVFGLGWDLSMQEHVPEEMLSRIYSYDMLGSFVAIPVGQLTFGPLGAAFGVQPMILVAGVAYVAIALLLLCSPAVRHLRRAPVRTPVAAPAGLVSTTSAPAS
ncbi:MFS transporter [Nocardioides sp. GY 10113]|uniref:MFS transporter n=1 Tax=Nocardioides sp. GY 10113 TaxID=2569761 RepID=UPI0010A7E928|nr:MFS transporter [Nocardioides sp. GY 10113]TIC87491.1 MFS transporter [Nocardioides sp. GY 10113]